MRVGPEDITVDADGLTAGLVKPTKAVRFVHTSGRRICDVMWTTYPPLVLISTRLRDLLKREELTGWSTYPADAHDHEGKKLRNYFGFSVIGRAGPVDNGRSEKVWRGPHFKGGPKFQRYVGLFLKDDEWDGSDFVMPSGRSTIIATERVKDALQVLKIRNVQFDRLSTYERDVDLPS